MPLRGRKSPTRVLVIPFLLILWVLILEVEVSTFPFHSYKYPSH